MKKRVQNPSKEVAYMAFLNRENDKRHHYYAEEMKQYELMKAGDPSAVEESHYMMTSNLHGKLSNDPVRDCKYLFVANCTLTTRFAIEGGMDSETAYNISDLYIQKMDLCRTVDEVLDMHREMFTYFTESMTKLHKENIYSLPVLQCMEYIDEHLHQKIGIPELSDLTSLHPNYLSTLFKKETGIPISDHIMNRRIDTAKNMLRYSEYNAAEISNFLAFSSQSYFIKTFKKLTGQTPHEYQKHHARQILRAASGRAENL